MRPSGRRRPRLSRPDRARVDYQQRHGLFWLPPIVESTTTFPGTFDGTKSPTLKVCALNRKATACDGTDVVSLAASADATTEKYSASWNTALSNLDPRVDYRIRAYDGTTELGFADVEVVKTQREASRVDRTKYVPLINGETLQINFRLEGTTAPWVGVKYLGSNSTIGYASAADSSGNVYVAGSTYGSLDGANAGAQDAFLAKYDASGAQVWVRQWGTQAPDAEFGAGVAVDPNGNVYVTGSTLGNLGDGSAGTNSDGYLAMFAPNGSRLWLTQFGEVGPDGNGGTGPVNDYANAVAVDTNGNAFVTGGTYRDLYAENGTGMDPFLAKFDTGGTRQRMTVFTSGLDTANQNLFDEGRGVALDSSGNAYVAGRVTGTFCHEAGCPGLNDEAFLTKLDASGTLVWSQKLGGNGDDQFHGVAADANGNVVAIGHAGGAFTLNEPLWETVSKVLVARYDPNGNLQWYRYFDTGVSGWHYGRGVALDGTGNAIVVGDRSQGGVSTDVSDALVAKYDLSGNRLWLRPLASPSEDYAYGVATDGHGNAFVAGRIQGTVRFNGTPSEPSDDAFVAKYDASGTLK